MTPDGNGVKSMKENEGIKGRKTTDNGNYMSKYNRFVSIV